MKPKSPADMRPATSWMVSPGRAICTSRLMTSLTFTTDLLAQRDSQTPVRRGGSGRRGAHEFQTTGGSGGFQRRWAFLMARFGRRGAPQGDDRHEKDHSRSSAGGVG